MNWNPWKRIRELEERSKLLSDHANDEMRMGSEAFDALERIAACETPGANATVKRMAKIAREALGE